MRSIAKGVLVAFALVLSSAAAWAQKVAPGTMSEAEKFGLPLLVEFVLAPGADPFVLPYPCLRPGTQRMVAVWGATGSLKLTVYHGGPDPITNVGSPASVTFPGAVATRCKVVVAPADQLQTRAVVAVYGGPDGVGMPPGGGRSWAGADSHDGLPLLVDFMLNPGDDPFVLPYPAMHDGPHEMIATWGANDVPIMLGVRAEGHGAVRAKGNPVSANFTAEAAKMYRIIIAPAQKLTVPVVGQLFGGPREAAPTAP